MQKKIPTTDLEEISCEIEEIQNLVGLMDAYLESAPAITLPQRELENRRAVYSIDAPTYMTVMTCIGMRLHSLQESIEATLQEENSHD